MIRDSAGCSPENRCGFGVNGREREMKKRHISFLLALLTVLATTVLLSQPSAAKEFGDVTIVRDPVEGGTVIVTPPKGPYEIGAYVTLQAVPAKGYAFSGWSDTLRVVSGTSTSTDFNVAGVHIITASFTQIAKTCYTLSTTTDPAAGGTITMPVDESCSELGQFTEGSTPTITAVANDGYKFDQWTGSPPGTVDPAQLNEPSIVVAMDQNRSVTAKFVKVCQPLTLSTNGEGADIVATPTTITCPNDLEFKIDETTTLTADPANGWKVTSWDIGGTKVMTSNEIYILTMPALPFGEGLLVQVNYEEKATFGFASDLPKTIAEDAGKINIEVIRAENTLSDAATIQYTTVEDGNATAGKDFVAKSGSLNFAKGQNSATISITILDNNIKEPLETFSVALSKADANIKLGISKIEVQIIDNEGEPTIRFEEPVYTVSESETTIKVAVTVSPPPDADNVFVNFATEDGTATSGEDFVSITNHVFRIRLDNDRTRDTVTITLKPDDIDEADEETVRLILSDPVNAVLPADSEGVLKILDDDDPPAVAFSESDYYIQKSSGPTALIPVNLSEPSGQHVEVDYKITLQSTGAITEGTLGLPAGTESNNLEVSILPAAENDLFTLQLRNPQNAQLRTDDPEFPNAARLFVTNTGIEDCHELNFTFSGYGQPPSPIGKASSLGCPNGQYVAGDFIEITAHPEFGWYVDGWTGTIDDESTTVQNAVEMPDVPHTVDAAYRVPIFFSVINKAPETFGGPNEQEPNNLFSQANGPILFDKDYRGNFSSNEDINDLYYFDLAQQTRVTITLKDIPNGRDYDLVLYDEGWIDGETVAQSREFDNLPEEIGKLLPPGRYFIQVFAGESQPSSARYRLRVALN
jgi:hypothetical protein